MINRVLTLYWLGLGPRLGTFDTERAHTKCVTTSGDSHELIGINAEVL